MTDSERLDKLDELAKGQGLGWLCRESVKGKGLRLYETTRKGAKRNIREAIDAFLFSKGYW